MDSIGQVILKLQSAATIPSEDGLTMPLRSIYQQLMDQLRMNKMLLFIQLHTHHRIRFGINSSMIIKPLPLEL